MKVCIKCNKEFNTNQDLNRHLSRKIPCDRILQCFKCLKEFKTKFNLERHKESCKISFEECVNNIKNGIKNDLNETKLNEKIINDLTNTNKELTNKLNDLTEKYNKIILENKLLKENINKRLEHQEQIYIMHERTFVELDVNIYKIGKTKNIKNRLNGYSKGSKLLFSIPCNNCTETERKILNFLKNNNKYIHAKEYGNEYFKCNLQDLISDIYKLIIP